MPRTRYASYAKNNASYNGLIPASITETPYFIKHYGRPYNEPDLVSPYMITGFDTSGVVAVNPSINLRVEDPGLGWAIR